ncbi:hypothetical protein EV401DRAFT_589579 [Pisolithus croceorrhizus]|nr:hypothetical protein EV401DRAFT_589579 [Pisolithus croceorrhizus]
MASTWSQRFCLDVTLGTLKVTEFAKSTVSSHLRICISTTQNRNWVFTTYPSEPFLSCAGAFLLHGNLERSLIALQDIIFSELVKVGESGKLARRLLWLLAKDLCVRRTPYRAPIVRPEDDQMRKAELIDCQMISVLDYFSFVFEENFWRKRGRKLERHSRMPSSTLPTGYRWARTHPRRMATS